MSLAFSITTTPRGVPAALAVSRDTFGDALSAAVQYYEKGYEVQVTNLRTGEVYTEAQLLQARDKLQRARNA